MSRVNFRQHCEFHGDIPPELRVQFTQNEQAWATQADKEEHFTEPPFKTPENWIPIGVSQDLAMGFGTSLAQAHRERLALVEQDQFAKVWINTLLRCRFRMQYDAIHKRFSDMYRKDPSLYLAARMVLKCEPLIKFRDELPEESPEKGLNNATALRDDGKYTKTPPVDDEPEEEKESYEPQKVGVYLFRYREAGESWKLAMKIYCYPDTLPTAHLTQDNHLHVAYYVGQSRVKVIHFDQDQQVVDTWYTKRMRGPLVCDVDVVTDGHVVYERDGTMHSIEGQIISAVKRTSANLYLGTFAGHVYNVTNSTFVKTRDPLAVLGINTSGDDKYIIQTINDVTFDDRMLNVGRPLCSAVKGTMVVNLSKYGVVSICFMGANSFFKPPEKVTCDLNCILRYYKDGIFISNDGGEIVVMYPDGRLCIRKLIQHPPQE